MATTLITTRRGRSRTSSGSRYRRFRPRLVLGYQQDLVALITELTMMGLAEANSILGSALAKVEERQAALRAFGLSGVDLAPTVRYGAALRVLRDLLSQGWTIREDDEGIILDAPGRAIVRLDDPEAAKESIRRSFAFARDAQLREASTAEFIETMERRGIGRLFASGTELAARITKDGTGAIEPELQVIAPAARDETTGIRLQDVWRYARHFWSIPYQSTPGRNLFYLVRDRARAERPLVGIAALGNPVLGLAKRDDYFGVCSRVADAAGRHDLPQTTRVVGSSDDSPATVLRSVQIWVINGDTGSISGRSGSERGTFPVLFDQLAALGGRATAER